MVDSGCLLMSGRELERLEVVQRVEDRRLTQREASEILRVSERQVRRLCHAYREHGAAGLVSAKRGKPSNRRHTDAFRSRVLELVRGRYEDFGPTMSGWVRLNRRVRNRTHGGVGAWGEQSPRLPDHDPAWHPCQLVSGHLRRCRCQVFPASFA